MMNICRGKLGWTTSRRLLKVGTLLGTKSGDGGNAYTSAGCNRTNRMARIKLRKDSALLSSRKRSHDDSG
jgi:hypothetical protein